MSIIFAKSANNHGISLDLCETIINNYPGIPVGTSRENFHKLLWLVEASPGVLIEIIAIDFIHYYYVIHLKIANGKDKNDVTYRRFF